MDSLENHYSDLSRNPFLYHFNSFTKSYSCDGFVSDPQSEPKVKGQTVSSPSLQNPFLSDSIINPFLKTESKSLISEGEKLNKSHKKPLLINRILEENSKKISVINRGLQDLKSKLQKLDCNEDLTKSSDEKLCSSPPKIAKLDENRLLNYSNFTENRLLFTQEELKTQEFPKENVPRIVPVSPTSETSNYSSYESFDDGIIDFEDSEFEDCIEDEDIESSEIAKDPLNQARIALVNALSASLINTPDYKNKDDLKRINLMKLVEGVALKDPEFILKAALYTRSDLNVRTTSNFILAYASSLPKCRPYLKKYFKKCVRLPSDWLEIAEYFFTMQEKKGLPVALRKVLEEKFGDFDEYQLAKYNKQKKPKKMSKKDKARLTKLPAEVRQKKLDLEAKKLNIQKKTLSLKQLIRLLHVTKPAEYIMAIIGKKYPSDELKFARSGLLGIWEENKAGKRMKLAVPETWETQVSLKGNKAQVWEQLLDNKKLPFMAMLRNLRNMIKAGISQNHHNSVLRRLQDEKSVINSRQFPFRFFSAFEVLEQLRKDYISEVAIMSDLSQSAPKFPTNQMRGRGGKKNFSARKKLERKYKERTINYDETLLDRYCKALDSAVKIATNHNVKPIPGRTIAICDISAENSTVCGAAKGLGKPRTTSEIGLLLALMCKNACEDCTLLIFDGCNLVDKIMINGKNLLHQSEKSESILEKVKNILDDRDINVEIMKSAVGDFGTTLFKQLQQFTVNRTRVDNVLILGNFEPAGDVDSSVVRFLERYRNLVNEHLLYVNINLAAPKTGELSEGLNDPRNVYLAGFSDQMLRFVAERGNQGQLQYIEGIDRSYDLVQKVQPMSLTSEEILNIKSLQPAVLSTKSNENVRIFISSTFKDMQSERDVISRYVIPAIRRKVAKSKSNMNIIPVDLRWGIEEHEFEDFRTVEQCLLEVVKSNLMIVILGQRYGFIPSKNTITNVMNRNAPHFDWLLEFLDSGLSITHLEVKAFLRMNTGKLVFMLRESTYESVPEKFRHNFVAENQHNFEKMEKFKELSSNSRCVKLSYEAKYGGVKNGQPSMNPTNDFVQNIIKNLMDLIEENRENIVHNSEPEWKNEMSRIYEFIEEEALNFGGRRSFMADLYSTLCKMNTGILMISGKNGYGKSAIMAKLSHILHAENERCIVLPIFKVPGNNDVQKSFVTQILNIMELQDKITVPNRITTNFWAELLNKMGQFGCKWFILIDGFDDGELNHLIANDAQDVIFIVSSSLPMGKPTPILKCVTDMRFAVKEVAVPGLNVEDRTIVVTRMLRSFAKRLDDRAFSNQMRLVTSKRDAESPQYLKVACQFLRVFSNFDTLANDLRILPSTLKGVFQLAVEKLEADFGKACVIAIMLSMQFVPQGLTETALYDLCCILLKNEQFMDTRFKYGRVDTKKMDFYTEWTGIMEEIERVLSTKPAISRSKFNLLLSSMTMFMDENSMNSGYLLRIPVACDFKVHPQNIKLAKNYIMGYFWWKSTEAEETDRNILRNSICLLEDYESEKLEKSLSIDDFTSLVIQSCWNMGFVGKCVKYGTTNQLVKFITKLCKASPELNKELNLETAVKFLTEKMEFLRKYPDLLHQEVYNFGNELRESLYCFGDEDYFLTCKNNHVTSNCVRSFNTGLSITAVTVDINKEFIGVGTREGTVILLDFATNSQLHRFYGHVGKITKLLFITVENVLYICSASTDTNITVWDVKSKSRKCILTNHQGVVSGICGYNWGKVTQLISVSWDSTIRFWSLTNDKCVHDIITNSAINCLDIHPMDPHIVSGHWDSAIRIYHTGTWKRMAVLRGHTVAVRCVIFTMQGAQIVSADINASIRVWSAGNAIQVGVIQGHTLPVSDIALHSNGLISTVSDDCTLKVYSEYLGQPIMKIQSSEIRVMCCEINSNKSMIILGYENGFVTSYGIIHNQSGGISRKFLSTYNCNMCVHKLMFCKKDKYLIVAHSNGVMIFNALTLDLLAELETCQPQPINCWDSQQDYIAIGHSNGVVTLFNIHEYEWKGWPECGSPIFAVHTYSAHNANVNGLIFSIDALIMVTVGDDKCAFVWSVGKLLKKSDTNPQHRIDAMHSDKITCCALSESKTMLITGSADCSVKVYNLEEKKEIGHYKIHQAPVTQLKMQKNNCVCSISSDGCAFIWSPKTGAIVTKMSNLEGIRSISLRLSIAEEELDYDSQVNSWFAESKAMNWAKTMQQTEDVQKKKKPRVKKVDKEDIDRIVENSLLAITDFNGMVEFYRPFSGNEIACEASHAKPIVAVTSLFGESNPMAGFISADLGGEIREWAVLKSEVEIKKRLLLHDSEVTVVKFTKDGSLCVSGDRNGNICLTDCTTNESQCHKIHTASITELIIVENTVVTCSEDMTFMAHEFSINSKQKINELKLDSPINSMNLEDESTIIFTCWDGNLHIYVMENDEMRCSSTIKLDMKLVKGTSMRNGQRIIFCEDERKENEDGIRSGVTCFQLSNEQRYLILGKKNGYMQLEIVKSGVSMEKKCHSWGKIVCCGFVNEDEEQVIFYSVGKEDRLVKIWKIIHSNSGNEWKLIHCWESPTEICSADVFVENKCFRMNLGDKIGNVYCLVIPM